ncbi:MAG: hypothetical protein WC350_03185 [Candidatus Micrarchaeia archaeon]|jgi:hypothetical protein
MAKEARMKPAREDVAARWEQIKDLVPVRLIDANPEAPRRQKEE